MKTEWASFAVSGEDVIEKSARECAYDYFEYHLPRNAIRLGQIRYYLEDDGCFFYEVEMEFDENVITEDQLALAGIGNR